MNPPASAPRSVSPRPATPILSLARAIERLQTPDVLEAYSPLTGEPIFAVDLGAETSWPEELGHATFAFLEQVGKNSFIYNRHRLCRVCYGEANRKSIVLAFERTAFHQSAHAKCSIDRRFLGCYLRRTKEENQIALEGTKNECGCDAKTCQPSNNKSDSFMTTFHVLLSVNLSSENSLCVLCVLCVSVVNLTSATVHHRDTENTELHREGC